MKRQTILSIVLLLLHISITVVLSHSITVAIDLPIDVEAIRRQGEEQQDAVTVRWQLDMFSETSDALSELLLEQRERRAMELESSMFPQPHIYQASDPNESVLSTSVEKELFSEPLQVRRTSSSGADTGISLWVIIPVLAASAMLGLLIALRTKTKSKR